MPSPKKSLASASQITTFTVRNQHIVLTGYRYGKASKKPVLLLIHGYPDNAEVWQPCAEILAENFQVFSYDLRGAGRSTAPAVASDYRIECLNQDLGLMIDAISPTAPVHLVGHDWGGIQTWSALNHLHAQGRILSFTAISGPSLDYAGVVLRQHMVSMQGKRWAQSAHQVLKSWYIWLFHVPGLAPAFWRSWGGQLWPKVMQRLNHSDARANAFQSQDGANGVHLYRANVFPRLRKPQWQRITAPVQVIIADNDPFLDPRLYEHLEDWVPALEKSHLAAGHWSILSHPAEVCAYIQSFIGKLSKPK